MIKFDKCTSCDSPKNVRLLYKIMASGSSSGRSAVADNNNDNKNSDNVWRAAGF